jgi:hypothetical protein
MTIFAAPYTGGSGMCPYKESIHFFINEA